MPTLRTRHLYKISDKDGNYLGVLRNVTSPFSPSQMINTVVTQLDITVGTTVDVAPDEPMPMLGEDGTLILDEDGVVVLADHNDDVVGDSNPNILIANDHIIEVYEFSDYYPNGLLVYKGYISKWKPVIGAPDNISLTCLTRGQDLGNYVIPGDTADSQDQAQATSSGVLSYAFGTIYAGQQFTVGAGVDNISAITLYLKSSDSSSHSATIKLWNTYQEAMNGTTPLATATVTVSGTSLQEYLFTFASPITVTPGQQYFFGMKAFNSVEKAYKNTNAYADGSYVEVHPTYASVKSSQDMYFKTFYSHLTTEHAYANTSDVSTDILTDIMGAYSELGGVIQQPGGGYDATAVTTAYTFKLNTILEGIQKCFELGPADWYYYAGMADETLYYKAAGASADHTLVFGKHIQELEIEATKEDIVNVVYFTGGPDVTGNNNVFVKVADTASLVNNRIGIARLTDNRVQGADGPDIAALLAQNFIDRNSDQTYIARVRVPETEYDPNLFYVGQMVGFSAFGNFVDDLLLQIANRQRVDGGVVLTLGTLPKREDQRVTEINKALADVQTLDNPDSPS